MAKYRYLYCEYWTDSEVFDFTPEEKLFYVYILTNMHTSQCGIYHIPIKIIEVETGYSCETIQKLIERFQETYGKLRYNPVTKELAIKNWAKHNVSNSPKVQKCIETELSEIKDKSLIEFVYGSDMVSILDQKEKEKEEIKEKEKEEIKQKEDDEKEEKENDDEEDMAIRFSPTSDALFKTYGKIIGKPTRSVRDKLCYFLKYIDPGVMLEAFKEAELYNKKSISYIEAILNNWLKLGIKTMYDYEEIKTGTSKPREEESDLNELIFK